MTFLPIVARELRVASRRASTYWSRTGTASLCIGVGVFVYLMNDGGSSSQLGIVLFSTMVGLSLLHSLTVGVRHTADCLSEEKREGTLGLLFLTDLKGYDVVVGKLVSTSVNAFFGLLAILPIITISILMGGVTNGELWRVALVLVNSFFFSLSVGMFLSSVCKSSRSAMGWTFGAMLLFTLGLVIAENWAGNIKNWPTFSLALKWLNPVSSAFMVEDSTFKSNPNQFWASLACVHATAWLFLVMASFIVPRSWQDRPSGAKAQNMRDKLRAVSDGGLHERHAHRRRLLDVNAYYWLAARKRFKGFWMWVIFAGLAGLWVWGERENRNEWVGMTNFFFTAFVLNLVLKIFMASESVRRLGEDRKIGSLELLLSTSLTVRDIIRGQLLALRRQFLWPVCFVLGIEIIYLVIAVRGEGRGNDDLQASVGFALAMMILLVADMLAMSYVGMWNGLTAKNPNRAAGMTYRKVVVFPVVASFAVSVLVSLFFAMVTRTIDMRGWGLDNINPAWIFLGLYLVPSVVADVVFGVYAWRRLNSQFRHAATQRYSGASSFWASVFKRSSRPAGSA